MAQKISQCIGKVSPSLRADQPVGRFALTGARLVTMRGKEIIERGMVLVEDGRILAVGKPEDIAVPRGTEIIDVRGKTIIPGLIDVHAHFHRANKELWPRQNPYYIGNLAYGVTTIYDPSANTSDVFGQAEMEASGQLLAPRIYSSGASILGATKSTSFRDISSQEEAFRVVKNYAKYHPGPLKEYMQPYREQRQWLSFAARKSRITLTSHPGVHLYDRLSRVIDGYQALEHNLSNELLYEDVLRFVAASGIYYTPTLMVSPGIGGRYSRHIDPEDPKLNRLFPSWMIKAERGRFFSPGQQELQAYYQRHLLRASKTVAHIAKYGGNICVGGHGNGLPGLGTHWEMWALAVGGMDSHQILKAATLNGARKLNLEKELGSIAPGKRADMVILSGNPLEDIHQTQAIDYVIKNGRIYKGNTMDRVWPSLEKLAPWPWKQ